MLTRNRNTMYDKLRNVRKFYCGLIGLGKDLILQKNKEFPGSIGLPKDRRSELIYKVQCAFESQLVELCDYVVGNDSLYIEDIHTPSDFTALGYVISTASKQVSKLTLSRCTWDKDGLTAFSSSEITGSKFHSIKCLEVSKYQSEDCKAINALLYQLPCLVELSLLIEELMFSVSLEVFYFLVLEF